MPILRRSAKNIGNADIIAMHTASEKKQELKRCSDDGEPSQTAGKPMLDVLTGAGLCDTVVVVTRYFGGTLFGNGRPGARLYGGGKGWC